MRVSLFGLFFRRINLLNPSTEPVQLALLHLYISSLDVLFMFKCVCSRHDFQYMPFNLDLSIHVCLFMHANWYSSHNSLGCFQQPWTFMSRFQSLELVDSSGCLSEQRSESADHRLTVQSIFFNPLLGSRVFLL